MADNTRLSAGTADGATIATDDDGTAHHQYVKVEFGANNTQTPVSATAPLPVQISDGTDTALVTAAGELNTLDKNSAAALTALQLIDDPVATLGTTTYTETTTKGMIVGAVRRDADTTLVDTTNEVGPLQMDANGRLKVEAFSGETLPVSLSGVSTLAEQQTQTTALQLIDDVVYTDDTSTHATGTSKGVGIMAAAVPTDTSISANDIGMVAMTTDRKLHVAVMDALPAGTAAIGKLAANSGVDIGDVDVTSISAGTNSIGNVGLIPRTTGGMLIFNSIDLDESEEEIKATAGQVFSISAFNRTAAPLYLRFYNATAANTTVGSTAAHMGPFIVSANADSDGAGFIWNNEIGAAFGTAISAAVTTGVAANDTGAPGANDCVVVVGYI